MSKRVRFNKDWNGYHKGQIVQLRERTFDEAVRAKAVTLDTAVTPDEIQTKAPANKPSDESSSDGDSQGLRTHNRRRR